MKSVFQKYLLKEDEEHDPKMIESPLVMFLLFLLFIFFRTDPSVKQSIVA